jgi:Fanconi-associated nuclease 1
LFVDAGWIFRVDHIHAYVLNANAHQKKRYVSVTPGIGHVSSTVEDLALLHYADDDLGNWRGVHAESRFWTMIFSLLFADIIFMPVVGAFHSPFQSKPFDLNTADFTSVRRCAINQRMASIRRGDSRPIITRSWSAHFDKKIPGVFWHLLRIEDICDILDGLGGLALSYMMKLLADDYGAWSIGAPDLLLWKKTNDFPAMVKFVEVKSSNDHLTEQQQAWFTALHDAGVDVAICKVSS